jgi:hypothetical protein
MSQATSVVRGVGLLAAAVLCLALLAGRQRAAEEELLGGAATGAAKKADAFWDDDDDLWSGAPQASQYVVFEKKNAAASSAAPPARSVAAADKAHQAVAAARSKHEMRSDIDKLSAAAYDLVKATEQTAASKAQLRTAHPAPLKSPSPRHPAHARKNTHTYKGVDLDAVYNKAFDAAFQAAYGGAYKSALGKAEQKLWHQVQKGRKARLELDALEHDKERALRKSSSKAALPALKKVSAAVRGKEGKGTVQGKALLQQKKVVWQSVPLGGESQMRTGPEFTDGQERYGPLERHCSTGNCEPLEDKGVNVDAWKGLMFDNIYRTVPIPRFDPTEDPVTRRAMAQRTGRFAVYDKSRKDDGVTWGGKTEPLKDPTWERLAKHGVNVGSAYWGKEGDLYRAMPLPGFDDTQFDHSEGKHAGKSQYMDAKDHMQAMRDQDGKLEEAGVVVNRYPAAFSNKGYTTVDGVPDRLVKPDALPAFRKDGVSTQEEPTFWLRDDADTQLNTPQWQESGQGVEEPGVPATELQGDLSKAGVNVDTWPEKLGHLWDSTVPSTGPDHGFLAQGIIPRAKGILQK